MNDERQKPAKRRSASDQDPDLGTSLEITTRKVSPARPTPIADRPDAAVLLVNPHEKRYLSRTLLGLTAREREVVFAICAGGTNEETADRLCIALPTLRTHLMRLNQKLGTNNKGDVVRLIACQLLEGYRAGSIATDRPSLGAETPSAEPESAEDHRFR